MSLAEWGKVSFYGVVIVVLLWITVSRFRNDHKPVVLYANDDLVLDHVNDSFRNTLIAMTNRLEDHFETEYDNNYHYFMQQITEHFRIGTDYAKAVERSTGQHPGCVFYVKNVLEPEDETQAWEITLQTGIDTHEVYLIPWNNMAHCIDCLAMLNKNNQLLVTRAEKSLTLSKI